MASTQSILENVFGMLGIIFWSFQLLPQVIDNHKAKSTEGLSYSMFFIWVLCALGFGSYGIVENLSIPIIVQPQIFGSLSALCYLQCLHYGKQTRWSLRKTAVAGVLMFVVMAGIQVAAVYATRAGKDHQVKGTTEAAGIVPIILLAMGFVPQYIDIYRDRSVVGVSMAFIAADAGGAVFSIISLCFRETLDLLATLNYVVVLICDLIIVGLYVHYNKLNPSLARVRDTTDRCGAEYDVEKATVETESAVTAVVAHERIHSSADEEGLDKRLDQREQQTAPEHHRHHAFHMHGTTVPNHLYAKPVVVQSQRSLSSEDTVVTS
ncbi:PQ loop repeat-domain-containing protein [Gamsiella multidivaricata]|uniref:PQ loop repeat-domain-containing protein n=1 Tax=Gamsiella multidivaricata TaxID=101098 RepID=UPI002220770F|nr:PQ loop repeat-domain-containing protein [Gamsiella multidivaricata]KAG0368944.1 hypothetical protein BGZ54_000748 [Gamsiella multidivaricata]KAI7824612.1 PQ loop repeat-domain-containing protein [Gamsiella multidivaricata]